MSSTLSIFNEKSFNEIDLYPSIEAKIARIAYGLVSNHPFVDGNKRIGTYVMLILIELNNIKADFTDGDIIRIGMELASGDVNETQLLSIILDTVNASKGE